MSWASLTKTQGLVMVSSVLFQACISSGTKKGTRSTLYPSPHSVPWETGLPGGSQALWLLVGLEREWMQSVWKSAP